MNNWLARIFDWLGDALERFNPSAFRFLAAVLPYLTPVPVAWLTAHSSSTFLKFTPTVSFIFVFALEGIGLWFTTMFVDSIVDWVRSKNWKSFVPVLMFAGTVSAYVFILVDLNVTLERAIGNPNPALSRVITLLCFLPLITGVGNGYYKLKLEHKTESQKTRERQEEERHESQRRNLEAQTKVELEKLETQARYQQEQLKAQTELEHQRLELQERLELEKLERQQERWKLKHVNETSKATSTPEDGNSKTSKSKNGSSTNTSRSSKRLSPNQQRVFSYLEQQVELVGEVPSFKEVMEHLELPQSTASRLRNEWLENRETGKQ
jgi:hypothetical protein